MSVPTEGPGARTTTIRAADLQLIALKRLGAARDILGGVLAGQLDTTAEMLDAIAPLVGRASYEIRLAREVELVGE